MVKFDVGLLRYLNKEDFRIIIAVEMGMKNHELVPDSLVAAISCLRGGGVSKILQNLCRHKLLAYERGKRYDGYRLTYLGYDYIALNALRCSGSVSHVGNQIGVGKESDVYIATGDEGQRYALKLHRLGRTCFRNVNNKRDYHAHGKKLSSWIYASRLAATREAAFLKILHSEGLPVPDFIASNRHVVVMSLLEGTLLNNITPEDVSDPDKLYDSLMSMILTLANKFGLVHGDFNEFNIMIMDVSGEAKLIDFPQMVPVNHKFARAYFDRDVSCISSFFNKRFGMEIGSLPDFDVDVDLEASNSERMKLIDLPDFPNQYLEGIDDVDDDETNDSITNMIEELDIDSHIDTAGLPDESGDHGAEAAAFPTDPSHVAIYPEEVDPGNEDGSVYAEDNKSVFSAATSKSTIAPAEIRDRLKRQKSKAAKRQELKSAAKNVKGEDSAVTRKRKDLFLNIRDDMLTHSLGEM